MGLRNLGGVRKAIQDAKQRNNSQFDNSWRTELRLIASEVATFRVLDLPEQPFVFRKHSMSKMGNDYGGARCLMPERPCHGCTFAETEARGTKRVKRASDVASFIIYSCRKVALIPFQKQDGTTGNRYVVISKNAQGQTIYKAGGNIQIAPSGQIWIPPRQAANQPGQLVAEAQYRIVEEGFRVWTGSLHSKANNALAIINLEEKLRARCMCGGQVGTGADLQPASIVVQQYTCSNCSATVQFDPRTELEVVCHSCHQAGSPDEEIGCSASCGNPRRGSVIACYIRATRTGGGTDTAYTFVEMPFSDIDPAHAPQADTELPDPPKMYPQDEQKLLAQLAARGLNAGPQQPGQPPQGQQFGVGQSANAGQVQWD